MDPDRARVLIAELIRQFPPDSQATEQLLGLWAEIERTVASRETRASRVPQSPDVSDPDPTG